MQYFQVGLGLLILLASLYLLSEDRKSIQWKMLGFGFLGQIIIALLLLKAPLISQGLGFLNHGVQVLEAVTTRATAFLFGYLAGGISPFESVRPESEFIVAFRVLPLILVVSALSAVLYHWRVLPKIIQILAKSMMALLKIRAPLGFGSAAAFFMGTIEAPLIVRPYLARMSRSDLFALITCTMATISGSVMVLYAGVVGKVVDLALAHMLTASLISIPAAIIIAKAWIPDHLEEIEGAEDNSLNLPSQGTGSTLEALVRGTLDGLDMVLKITAIIIVLFALVYLGNEILAVIPTKTPLTIEGILGKLLAPIMWLTGIVWVDASSAGELMGTKVVLNEFVAYLKLGGQLGEGLLPKSQLILTYALCGFANLASVGIVVGGLTSMMPDRSKEVIELCTKSLVSGNLATLLTAAIVGLMV
ncbi:NupC/NupG family nucleoside CNT transporter [Pseudobacteriovorax antillogorgiicola]|uniref:Concentrative nucleoside transporter, CNT family n=1 Tax=Pseudobacteriovorax antillogorgiicola TaxID=1513793 RepID=A0A1Y6CAD1_9BACT|nr:nucleoside transporter C-terminal domain-containing protein [Pseudobacteriovorax antillogorgiicola]TCS49095.1 CNT family concentrative nucleoside transporter [Pseudobacteriovorax antillogorgiicola]SMF51779.1 concentrative nucleoside transporter, CNT family [Pseudobacteriovorax antillogorgiicola]